MAEEAALESLVSATALMAFGGAYSGRRVLVTGHNGFKGSWLALWLQTLGADVRGLSLPPDAEPNHWSLLKLDVSERHGDIRDAAWLKREVHDFAPEVVFHLAAQSLVRRSYAAPLDTWSSNVMGMANLLEACRNLPALKAVVAVTTDKVYENNEWCWGYRENDRLGGHDPYSASKAASEQVVASYRAALFPSDGPRIASARAGNVIGGGDWCEDRLIPDLVRSIGSSQPLLVRSPNSTRPWQHVLECLAGYLLLGQGLLERRKGFDSAWNFGPDTRDNRRVIEVLQSLQRCWPRVSWELASGPKPHEAQLLYLDNARAKSLLRWSPVWNLETTLEKIADWYRQYLEQGSVSSRAQLADYQLDAQRMGAVWIGGTPS